MCAILSSLLCLVVVASRGNLGTASSCELNDLTPKLDINSSKPSWAVVCLIRRQSESGNRLRHQALANLLRPYAPSHKIDILMFSEDNFDDTVMNSWYEVFNGIGKVKLVNVRSRAYFMPTERYGYKWMCKFFTVDMYDYIKDYDYYLRVDSDNVMQIAPKRSYDLLGWVEQNQIEYGYIIRKFEPHQETRDTLPEFVRQYVDKCDVKPKIKYPSISILFNFYNNFHVGKVSFFNRPDVRHFLVATNTSGKLYQYRWGDSTIQAMAVRLFMDPKAVQRLPNISYRHISHGNKLVSSVSNAKVDIPQVFPNGDWVDDPSLSDLSLVMKIRQTPAVSSIGGSNSIKSGHLHAAKYAKRSHGKVGGKSRVDRRVQN